MEKLICTVAAALLASAMFISASPAKAEYMTGNQLYRYCTGTTAGFDLTDQKFVCLAYIEGAHDGLETSGAYVSYVASLEEPMKLVCVPEGVEAGQLQDIVTAYLRDHPEDRNLSASLLVLMALRKAYPCAST